MSPEQAGQSSLDVDTRTDVYAPGVLLYEMLTGTTPVDPGALRMARPDEVRRMAREDDPPSRSAPWRRPPGRPSRTSGGQTRGGWPAKVRAELDWVVMRSLEKDRNRRYESAAALAADARRFLADEPVAAVVTAGAMGPCPGRGRVPLAAPPPQAPYGVAVALYLATGGWAGCRPPSTTGRPDGGG